MFSQLWETGLDSCGHWKCRFHYIKTVKSSAESAKREEAAKQGEVFEIKIKNVIQKRLIWPLMAFISLLNIWIAFSKINPTKSQCTLGCKSFKIKMFHE